MRDYIKLQLKLRWGANRDNNKKSALLTGCAGVLVIVVMLALIWLLTIVITKSIDTTPKEFSQIFLTAIQFGLVIMSITMQLKLIYKPSDVAMTARFPISAFKVYLSNLIIVYLDLLIYSFMLVLPVMVVFGIAENIISFKYVVGIIIGAFFAPMIPFAISTFIAIPVMWIAAKLENRNVVRLVIFIVVLIALFVLYNYLLTMLADYFIKLSINPDTKDLWQRILSVLNSKFNIFSYIAGIVFFDDVILYIGIVLLIAVVFSCIGIVLARLVQSKVRSKTLENGGTEYMKVTKTDNHGANFAMFRHNFKEIIRNRTYAYFYLGIALATPVMVFFCNRLVTQVGQAQIGANINFGASLLVISTFMALISAFSGAMLSMEKKNFYITKLVPIKYKKQLLIKALLNLSVSVGALLVSCIILAVLKFITAGEMAILIFMELALSVGFVFNGMNLNLLNPNLRLKANGEADEINITIMMMIGMVLSALLGAASLILPFILNLTLTYIIVAAVILAYLILNVVGFFVGAEKRYRKIEI